jgi:hypothetical protein
MVRDAVRDAVRDNSLIFKRSEGSEGKNRICSITRARNHPTQRQRQYQRKRLTKFITRA